MKNIFILFVLTLIIACEAPAPSSVSDDNVAKFEQQIEAFETFTKGFYNEDIDELMSVVADSENFLEQLLNLKSRNVSVERNEWVALCHQRYLNNDATQPAKNANDGLDFAHLIDALGDLAPDDSVITNDAGYFSCCLVH